MAQIRIMYEREAERVHDLWLQMLQKKEHRFQNHLLEVSRGIENDPIKKYVTVVYISGINCQLDELTKT